MRREIGKINSIHDSSIGSISAVSHENDEPIVEHETLQDPSGFIRVVLLKSCRSCRDLIVLVLSVEKLQDLSGFERSSFDDR